MARVLSGFSNLLRNKAEESLTGRSVSQAATARHAFQFSGIVGVLRIGGDALGYLNVIECETGQFGQAHTRLEKYLDHRRIPQVMPART